MRLAELRRAGKLPALLEGLLLVWCAACQTVARDSRL